MRDERCVACVLIVFGIVIYTNAISFVSGSLSDERSMIKKKKYGILQELNSQSLIDKSLTIQISDNIESIFNNSSLVHNEEWMHLIPHVKMEDQLMVADPDPDAREALRP